MLQVQLEMTAAAVSPVPTDRLATENSSLSSEFPRLWRRLEMPTMPKAKRAPRPTTTP